MDISWLDPERLDRRDVDSAVAALEAARSIDSPHRLSQTVTEFVAGLRYGWDGDRSLTALAKDDGGRVVAILEVILPKWDNPRLGLVWVTVDPASRRQGIGRQLFELGVARCRADERTLIGTDCYDLPASRAFLEAMGLAQASVELQRRQDLLALDWDRLDREFGEAERNATDYELVLLPGVVPDELVDDILRMTEAINDAPTDDWEIDDEVFSAERLRAFEISQAAHGRRLYRVVARHRATGELAGHTVVGLEAERPWFGWQYDTSVLRTHRGHRLGLLLKIGMLRWLRTVEPQLRTVDTWNAASNDHMIAINEMIGYRVVATGLGWQRRLPEHPEGVGAVATATASGARQPQPAAAPHDRQS